MNNLFGHADKELVIDAFLCWLITEMNEDYLEGLRNDFLHKFLNYDESASGVVKELQAAKQVNSVDVLCTIKTDQGDKQVLFENKLRSTAHGEQLKRYRQQHHDAIGYIYLKLGYVHLLDKEAVESENYTLRTAEDFANLLAPHKDKHPFIREFHTYVKEGFVNSESQFESYVDENHYEHFDDASFQQYVVEKIYQNLLQAGWSHHNLNFKIGTNRGGTPWTQLDFSQIREKYGPKDETLFFRIDQRSGMYYLRVNLYSQDGKKYWQEKEIRVKRLREVIDDFNEKSRLNHGTVHNRAKNEVEIVIYFFEEGNSLANVIEEAAQIAKVLRKAHQVLG